MKKDVSREELAKQDHVRAQIADRAYFISESEGFPHGRDFIHWMQAEEEVIAKLFHKMTGAVSEVAARVTGKGASPKANGKPEVTKAAAAAPKAAPKPKAAAKPPASKKAATAPKTAKPAAKKKS